MALWIRDGFEIYASTNDMFGSPAGYGIWTGSLGTFGNNWGLTSSVTRFNQGQALQSGAFSNSAIYYTNPSNQQTVFCALAVNVSGTLVSVGWQDTTANFQLFINFDGNTGNITATNSHGTLGTFGGAFVPGQWDQYQIKTVIDSVNGEVHIRKNGATSDTFAITGVNTQVSSHPYANGIFLNQNGGSLGARIDDFAAWDTTGSPPWNDWIGDFRISQLQPVTDSAVQWTKTHPVGDSTNFGFPSNAAGPNAFSANRLFVWPFTPVRGGQLSSFTVNMNSGYTGHMRLALYDSNGNGGSLLGNGILPGALIASTNEVVNPGAGDNTFTWPATPPSVATGRLYFIGMLSDATATTNLQSGAVGDRDYAFTYGAFPAVFDNSLGVLNSGAFPPTIHATITFTNAACVGEPVCDDATTYVSDNVATDVDLYGVTSLPANAYTVLGADLVIRLQKSDAGPRTVSALLQSGPTLITETAIAPNTSWNYYRYQQDTDPNTGTAWSTAGINAVLIGQKVAT